MSDVQGFVEDGWGKVADLLRTNLKEGKDLGAGVCVYVDGRAVVDVWGGLADREKNRPWERDTIALVASTTKGAVATCAHLLAQRGELDLDAPVAKYWPEFGQAGKEDIPVRWLLSHQVGLPIFDTPVTFEEACTWEPVIRALEVQKPLWEPGTEHLYHAQTYGFLVGEVVRRISGKSLGTFFAEEIAGPLGLSAYIGVPEECESRIAQPEQAPFPFDSIEDMASDFAAQLGVDPALAVEWMQTMYAPDSVNIKAGTLSGVFTAENMERREFRAAEFPGGNMYANARSIARMYAATVSDVDGIRLLNAETVATMTQVQTDHTRMHGVPPALTPVADRLFTMSLGFWRPAPPFNLLGPTSFGHPGSGGSLGFGDVDARVGFGYVPNLWPATMVDPRPLEFASAVAACLE